MGPTVSGNRAIGIEELINWFHPVSGRRRTAAMLRGLSPSRVCFQAIAAAGARLAQRQRLEGDGSLVRVAGELSTDLLSGLFENRYCAIRVPGFANSVLCRELAAWLLQTCELSRWGDESGGTQQTDMYYGIGLPASALAWSRKSCRKYFEQVLPAIRSVRGAAGEQLNPTDRLRLELDELWPRGARIDTVGGHKRLVGMARVMRPEGLVDGTKVDGIIHVDDWPILDDSSGTFSANIYLRVPAAGGELTIWNVAPVWRDCLRTGEFFDVLRQVFAADGRAGARQQLLRDVLPPPIVLQPEQGELIIINSARPHAVRGFSEGYRVTLQTFIGYDTGEPLALFC